MRVAEAHLIPSREFATLDSCDEALVRRVVKNGRLPTLQDSSLDPTLAKTGWRLANRRLAGPDADIPPGAVETVSACADAPYPVAEPARAKSPTGVPAHAADAANLDLDDPTAVEAVETFIQRVLRGDSADLIEAEQARENGLALKHLLDARRKAGELVPLKAAEDAFFAAAREQRDAWQSWPARISTELAAELDIDGCTLTAALIRLVHQHLSELGEPEFEPGLDVGEG